MHDKYPLGRTIIRAFVFFVSVTLIAFITYGSYYYLVNKQDVVEYTNEAESFSLDSEIPLQQDPSGVLYFSAKNTQTEEVDVYQYDISQNSYSKVTNYGGYYGYEPVNDSLATAIIADQSEVEGQMRNIYAPFWINYNTLEYDYLFPESFYGAFSLSLNQSATVVAATVTDGLVLPEDPNYHDLSNWKIVAKAIDNDQVAEIFGASRSVWINDGADMIFLSKNGIEQYHTENAGIKVLDETYRDLDIYSDLAISPNNQFLILTTPTLSAISVYGITDSENLAIEEVGRYVDTTRIYTDPVFNSDGTYYAVLTTETNTGNQVIEIRSVNNKQVVRTISNPAPEILADISISGWSRGPMLTIIDIASNREGETENTIEMGI